MTSARSTPAMADIMDHAVAADKAVDLSRSRYRVAAASAARMTAALAGVPFSLSNDP
jgi:hypothetical protein